tara:strand:- start:363 stop:872 length:510 start_codon:yes stop_codon:yes gene_type:complete
MAANEHKNLLDVNRHNPMGFESARNNSFLSKGNGATADGLDGSLGWRRNTQSIIVALSDETSDLTTGDGKITFRMPYAFILTSLKASAVTAPTGSAITIDVSESGTTILSTLLTIDAGEKTSTTAATPVVISDSELADDSEIRIDVDTVGSTVAGTGLKVSLIGYKNDE